MKRSAKTLWLGSALISLSLSVNAQSRPYPQRDDDRYYPQRDPYQDQRSGNDRYGNGGNQGSLIARVISDLDRVASSARVDGHERRHFDEAARKLQDFESRWSQGRFDTGKLDKAIDNLQHLAQSNQLRGRGGELLARDVQDLRQLRFSGGRNGNYGYQDDRSGRYNQDRRYDPNWR